MSTEHQSTPPTSDKEKRHRKRVPLSERSLAFDFAGFPGFGRPRFTQTPDVLFDQIMADLTEAELKVLLYIIRHTYGYSKDDDNISINQMVNGIRRGDGTVLDRGTGLTRSAVKNALQGLRGLGLIVATRQSDTIRGNLPTNYSLSIDNTPPRSSEKPRVGHQKSPPSDIPKAPQDTVLQETTKQDTDHSNIRMAQAEKRRATPSESKASPRVRSTSKSFVTPGDVLAQRASGPYSPGASAPEGQAEEPVGKGGGKPPGRSAGKPRPETETEEWQVIQSHVADFMRQLGDRAPLKSSTTRAYNLFLASGTNLGTFINKMFEARSRTQELSGNIEQEGDDPTLKVKRKTKAAYFFAVLEDVLHLIDEEERKRREAGTGKKRGRPPKSAGDTPNSSNGGHERDSDGPFGAFVET